MILSKWILELGNQLVESSGMEVVKAKVTLGMRNGEEVVYHVVSYER